MTVVTDASVQIDGLMLAGSFARGVPQPVVIIVSIISAYGSGAFGVS